MEFKFPHTPHLAWLGPSQPRADKVLAPSEAEDFLSTPITIEEKVDGANIGISFTPAGDLTVKNRGTILTHGAHPQYQPLWPWLAQRQSQLHQALGSQLILYGEWCFAVHSIHYSALPDYFIAFDIYDQQAEKFFSVERRNSLTVSLGLTTSPILGQGRYSLSALQQLLVSTTSQFGVEPLEGIYLRRDASPWLHSRAKLVRPEFVQAIDDHWTHHPFEKNSLRPAP